MIYIDKCVGSLGGRNDKDVFACSLTVLSDDGCVYSVIS